MVKFCLANRNDTIKGKNYANGYKHPQIEYLLSAPFAKINTLPHSLCLCSDEKSLNETSLNHKCLCINANYYCRKASECLGILRFFGSGSRRRNSKRARMLVPATGGLRLQKSEVQLIYSTDVCPPLSLERSGRARNSPFLLRPRFLERR